VTGLLLDAVTAAFSARGETLERRSLVDVDARDLELIDIGAFVMLRIRDRRQQTFFTIPAAFFGENVRTFSALSTGKPRIWSATRRVFCAEMRAPR